ncbi:protein of unknown function DUF1549 [Polaromonas naphthalenivorans CJ2]|uniref:DUF1553 domain-containing protein n=2 Tax=Polaromonas naphthalenivorans TaxID=216465 RepID=A1VJR7_POLNA|nr:protein of unknown function DUF1549 [Polaromonas naphthalenivorans CJ2]MBH2018460.1 DUF1553 domain-containing protein [Burkholderiales bacterium]
MKNKAIYLSVMLGVLAGPAVLAQTQAVVDAARSAQGAAPKAWSAYQPVQAPQAPEVRQKAWVRTPIDAFVLSQLEAKGLKPSKEADRATFIRRATLDAWGLLPTPEEVKTFVADKSPTAYEKLADRLLASPHYGERQARRWLDLARYADSTGFQNDNTRPNNWRYRDYVIKAFNQDRPFSRFIQEQVAGDELWPESQDARIATGFLAGYPDNRNSRDLVQRKYQIETDMTDLVGETFLAATVGCARCHNHKSDKVSQKEYFQLQAFLANTAFNEQTPLAKGTETEWDKAYEQQQAAYQEATKDIRAKQKAILDTVREAGRKYYNERYLTDSREAIFKPEAQWTPLDRWVNWRKQAVATDNEIASYLEDSGTKPSVVYYNPDNAEKWKTYKALREELKQFDKIKPAKGSSQFTAALELTKEVPPTHVRFGGIHERPLEAVQPAIPALWGGKGEVAITPTASSSGRRTALANWLSSDSNPLTARVYANRVWAQYFDKGIISTVQDFGRAGTKPTNPELLDYLATNFVKNGWSVKKLHREILLSSVYRQSSDERLDVVKADPENKLLAFYPRKRLEAEVIRDSLLYASGLLSDKVGGPSVFPPVVKTGDVVGKAEDFQGNRVWAVSTDKEDWNRRSLYIFTRRSFSYPITQNFDPANPNQPHHKRDVTTTALQALTLFNSEVVFDWSQALAGRVINEAGGDETAQINRLYQILYSREPNQTERLALKSFLAEQKIVVQHKAANGKFEVAVPSGLKDTTKFDPVKSAAFVDLVHTVANSNEFAYRF